VEHSLPSPSRALIPTEVDLRRRSDEVQALLAEAAALEEQFALGALERDEASRRRAVLASGLLHLLQSWRRRGGGLRLELSSVAPTRPARSAQVVDAGEVRAHLARILAGLAQSEDDARDLERVHAAIRDSTRWAFLPRELRRAVVALCTTRLRHLQDDRGCQGPRLEEAFAMLTAYSKREQPGFVVGLSRGHHPVRGSWAEDAQTWWDRLSAWAEPGSDPVALSEAQLSVVERANLDLAALPAEARAEAGARLVDAVREALDRGLHPEDPRLVGVVSRHLGLFQAAEFRAVRRAAELAAEPTPAR